MGLSCHRDNKIRRSRYDLKEIWQIGLVDYDTGEVLIDEYLKHSCLLGCHCESMLQWSPDIDPEALGKLFQAKGISQCNIRLVQELLRYAAHQSMSS